MSIKGEKEKTTGRCETCNKKVFKGASNCRKCYEIICCSYVGETFKKTKERLQKKRC